MNIEAMKTELRELNAQAETLETKRRELRQQIADAQALFKVGERVTYDGAKYVWQITNIGVGYSNEPMYFGAALKKGGAPGAISRQIFVPHKAALRAA